MKAITYFVEKSGLWWAYLVDKNGTQICEAICAKTETDALYDLGLNQGLATWLLEKKNCYKLNGVIYMPKTHPSEKGYFAYPGIKKGKIGIHEKELKEKGAVKIYQSYYK